MNPIGERDRSELRARLLEDKGRLERRLAADDQYGLNTSLRDYTGELSAYDNHPADIGSEMLERGKDIALLENDERHLQRIGEALEAMEQGKYGVCRTCGSAIPLARLQSVPETLYCVAHSPQQEPSQRRPVEEQFLQPPFGRTSMDEQSSYAGFDGEDAWQIVESWGNSDSPAMAENPAYDYDNLSLEAQENEGYVEDIESFLATDITGSRVSVVRSSQYRAYLAHGEGDPLLEPDNAADD